MRYDTIEYEVTGRVAQIMLNRPEHGNRLSFPLLRELNHAFGRAMEDAEVRVVTLGARGDDFCLGREAADPEFQPQKLSVPEWLTAEEQHYIAHWRTWRDLPKPILAMVHGQARIGGVGLAQVCDLIYCATDAEFIDDSVRLGAPSVEYFHHPWDLGLRRTKELLYTSEGIGAEEAYRLGFVSGVFPREELAGRVRAVAERIAKQDPMLLKLTKYTVNGHQDTLGFRASQDQAYWMHMLSHARVVAEGFTPPEL
jgi:enoyl-CoA hydratase